MKYYVYALKSLSKNYIYVGMTNNLERRIHQHNSGQGRSTKSYAPFELIYSEEQPSRFDGRAREKYLKSGTGKEYLKSLL